MSSYTAIWHRILVCPVSKSDTNSFDFAIDRFLMKLFKTNNINIIKECLVNFGVILPSALLVELISLCLNYIS